MSTLLMTNYLQIAIKACQCKWANFMHVLARARSTIATSFYIKYINFMGGAYRFCYILKIILQSLDDRLFVFIRKLFKSLARDIKKIAKKIIFRFIFFKNKVKLFFKIVIDSLLYSVTTIIKAVITSGLFVKSVIRKTIELIGLTLLTLKTAATEKASRINKKISLVIYPKIKPKLLAIKEKLLLNINKKEIILSVCIICMTSLLFNAHAKSVAHNTYTHVSSVSYHAFSRLYRFSSEAFSNLPQYLPKLTPLKKSNQNIVLAKNKVDKINISDKKNPIEKSTNKEISKDISKDQVKSSIENRDIVNEINTIAPVYVMVHAKDNTTYSSEAMATVVAIPYRTGDAFHKGDTLLEFDCRVQKADLNKALAVQMSANNAYKSAKKLKSYDSISEYELIKAEADAKAAAAEVEKVTAILDKCNIKASYDGAVSDTMVQIGESVKPGDPLIKVVNTLNLELEMQIPSHWLEWLHIGTPFEVTINETQETLAAKVSKINPEIDSVSQTVKIIGVLQKPDLQLLPGMSGQATFLNAESNSGSGGNNVK